MKTKNEFPFEDNSVEIKPCPFCGAAAKLWTVEVYMGLKKESEVAK